ncbi:hypothetical protein HK097_007097 [Rhizophlyctis rosea]|uniref:Uncharacterized protein n=1 Tax=Rhizophlyctis rosea TaxID=64517 RepID=A0AAD5SE77_9FUNG|nr:hypothetical protein HK097_007097 [Rhizophlyctis rosea]
MPFRRIVTGGWELGLKTIRGNYVRSQRGKTYLFVGNGKWGVKKSTNAVPIERSRNKILRDNDGEVVNEHHTSRMCVTCALRLKAKNYVGESADRYRLFRYEKGNRRQNVSDDLAGGDGDDEELIANNPGDLEDERLVVPSPPKGQNKRRADLPFIDSIVDEQAKPDGMTLEDPKSWDMHNMRTQALRAQLNLDPRTHSLRTATGDDERKKVQLTRLKAKGEKIHAVVQCRHCNTIWRRDNSAGGSIVFVGMERVRANTRPAGYRYIKPGKEDVGDAAGGGPMGRRGGGRGQKKSGRGGRGGRGGAGRRRRGRRDSDESEEEEEKDCLDESSSGEEGVNAGGWDMMKAACAVLIFNK